MLAEAARLSPRDPEIQQSWGDALWRIGEIGLAAAAFRRSIQLAPGWHRPGPALRAAFTG